MNSRQFLTSSGLFITAGTATLASAVAASHGPAPASDPLAVLNDTTFCIGCRRCELACDRRGKLTSQPAEAFDDKSVFRSHRPLSPKNFTVVNRYPNPRDRTQPIFAKTQCMHCNKPACVSACIVGALRKTPDGPVTYDYDKCIGCRYCMVACPFQVPTYEFSEPLRPRVMKCDFCSDRIASPGGTPACVDACPVSALIFGRRSELLRLAHNRFLTVPGYNRRIYGESEAGGSSWLMLAGVPFDHIGMPRLGDPPPPALSEGILHSVFKNWIPPLSLFGLLGAAMWVFKRRDEAADPTHGGPR